MASSAAPKAPSSTKFIALLDFHAALKGQQSNSNPSDFQIICGDTTYNVHRFLISLHSNYFKRLCEGQFTEAASRSVTLQDDHPAAVKIMIDYFYQFTYNPDILDDKDSLDPLEVHSQVFTLADKHDIANLMALALEQMKLYVGVVMSKPLLPLHAGTRILSRATAHAYMNSPPNDDRMRRLLVQAWLDEDEKMMKRARKSQFDKLLADAPDFAPDLVSAMSGITMTDVESDT